MSAEKLRTARIVLLKVTHWPFVGLILAWEKAQRYWTNGQRVKPSFGLSRRGPRATRTVRRDLSGMSFKQPLLATATLQPPLVEQARADRSNPDTTAKPTMATSETVEALETAVQDLRAQVESLASLLVNKKTKSSIAN